MENDKKPGADAQNGKKTVLRSPNYPAISLEEAISKAHVVYQHEKRAATAAGVILKHLGYREERGGLGGRILSALRQYGLLEDKGGDYRISDLANNLLHLSENSEERQAAVREAAQKPNIFREILSIYPDGLPSDETLKNFLISKKGFNPDSVDRFVRVFRGTIELAKLTGGQYTGREEEGEKEGAMPEVHEDQDRTQPRSSSPAAAVQTYSWALSIPRNVRAELRLYGQDLRREDVDTLKKYLELLEVAFQASEAEKSNSSK